MDQNNLSGMSFVTGDDNVPENLGDNSTLSNVANQQVQETQNTATPVQEQPTLSSVVSQPVQEAQNTISPVQENVVTSTVVQTQEAQNTVTPVQEQPTLSSVVSQPVQEVQNTVPPVQEDVVTPTAVQTQEAQNTAAETTNVSQPQQTTNVVSEDNNKPVEDIKQNKLKRVLIIVVVLLALTAIGIVLGFVLFDKFGNKGGNSGEDTTTTDDTIIRENVINNYDVDAEVLTGVLQLLGIRNAEYGGNVSELTYYVTDENYRDNAKDIITYYAILGSDMSSSIDSSEYKDDNGACGDSEGCVVVSKSDAEKIIKMYDFEGTIEEYFYKSDASDDVYGIRYDSTLELPQFVGTNLGIGHNLLAKYVGDDDIEIEDAQIFNYNDDENQLKNVKRTVRYTFKKGDSEEYHLDGVLINE